MRKNLWDVYVLDMYRDGVCYSGDITASSVPDSDLSSTWVMSLPTLKKAPWAFVLLVTLMKAAQPQRVGAMFLILAMH